MKVSIFTATHNTQYLLPTYLSIKDQPYDEWVLFPNNGITLDDIPSEIKSDSRTKIVGLDPLFTPIIHEDGLPNIGSVKKFCCSQCSGDILVELDHDDLLLAPGIQRVKEVFIDPEVVFAFSNTAEFNEEDKSPRMFGSALNSPDNYDDLYGWRYRDFYYEDTLYKEAISPHVDPHNVSIILFAPNHFRSFRKSTYDKIGGYDETLHVCDDQDLMCRLYLEGKFEHIDECCYLYRVYGSNSWLIRNKDIQTKTFELQKKYLHSIVTHWAVTNKFDKIDIGGRFSCPPGYISVDRKNADIITDLNEKWPFEDSSVGVVRAFDVIEHLRDPIHTMREMHRVLRPGGYALIQVPSTDGRGAWQDPTHISFWNQNSFFYYLKRNQAKYIDNYDIRFKEIILETYFPSDWELNNNISYVRADLCCLKGDYRPMGLIEI